MVLDAVEVEAARSMRTVLITYGQAFQEFLNSSMDPEQADELAASMEEIKLAKLHLFRLMPCELIDLLLGHSELMSYLWDREFNDIRGLPAANRLATDDEGTRLRASHQRSLSRVEAACCAIIEDSQAGRAAAIRWSRAFIAVPLCT